MNLELRHSGSRTVFQFARSPGTRSRLQSDERRGGGDLAFGRQLACGVHEVGQMTARQVGAGQTAPPTRIPTRTVERNSVRALSSGLLDLGPMPIAFLRSPLV